MSNCLKTIILLVFVFLTACSDDRDQILCQQEVFAAVSNAFLPMMSNPGNHGMQYNDGTNLLLVKEMNTRFVDEIDENGCFVSFREFLEIKYFNGNQLEATILLKGEENSIHKLSLTVSSLQTENNTNNLFEADMNSQAEVINCNTGQIECVNDYIHNGSLYSSVLKWTRSPLLPSSSLVEITTLVYHLEKGILYIELENGSFINYHP